MADTNAAREKPLDQFYEQVEAVHAGMLGVNGSDLHMQPMAPQVDRPNKTIWFFTRKDAAIMRDVKPGARAHFTVVGKDHDYHACVGGPIEESMDREVVEKFWNPIVAAWYEDGKDDTNLTLLALRLEDGEAWASTDSSLKFGWEIAKANVSGEQQPDVGVKVPLKF